jgi:hypothetical protein
MARRSLIAVGVCLPIVGALGVFLRLVSGPPEPEYEGRTFSSWLEGHVASSAANPPYNSPGWHKAEDALRRIGTNGIPTLLGMIRAKDPPPALRKFLLIAQRWGWLHVSRRPAYQRNEEAEYAFRVLGTNAASAVPELIQIYQDNGSPSSQRCAALALGSIGQPARSALPVLLRDFSHTNPQVRFYAVSAVLHIGGDYDVVAPPLARALQDSNVNVRWNALTALARFGSRARPLVPEIQAMLNDPGTVGTTRITEQVENTLWEIAPEKVGKPLVVEDVTPIIANGMTIEALKVVFHGKRQTLIPAGKSVPVLYQYWNSDPRPRLTLYRGATNSDEKDHFLGHFEVMDVPTSTFINISTLCVIADGQMVLCARDNTRKQFLEIRRIQEASAR